MQNMQQRHFEHNVKTFCPFYVWSKGRLWHFMFVQGHGVSTLKYRKSHGILNKPSNAAALFLFSSVSRIVASWKWTVEMFRCKPTQNAITTSEHNLPVLIRLEIHSKLSLKMHRLKDDIQALVYFKGQWTWHSLQLCGLPSLRNLANTLPFPVAPKHW